MEVEIEISSLRDAVWRLTTRVYVLEDFITQKFGSTVLGERGQKSSLSNSRCSNCAKKGSEPDKDSHLENGSFQNIALCSPIRPGKRKFVSEMQYEEENIVTERHIDNNMSRNQQTLSLNANFDSHSNINIKREPEDSDIIVLDEFHMENLDESEQNNGNYMEQEVLDDSDNERAGTQHQQQGPLLNVTQSKPEKYFGKTARRDGTQYYQSSEFTFQMITHDHNSTLPPNSNSSMSSAHNINSVPQLQVKPGYSMDTKKMTWSNYFTYLGHLGPSTMKWQCVLCSVVFSVASSSYCNAYRHYQASHNQDIRTRTRTSKPKLDLNVFQSQALT